jgi:hypothetical protein
MKKGLNFTVRNGLDWASALSPEDEVNLVCPIGTKRQAELAFEGQESEYVGRGLIVHVISCALKDVPPIVFKNHHDERCKNPISLFHVLQKTYKETLTDETLVTCIGFNFTGPEE